MFRECYYNSLNLSQKKECIIPYFLLKKKGLLKRGLNYLWNQTEAEVESQKGKILLIQCLATVVVVAAGGVFEDGGEQVAVVVR